MMCDAVEAASKSLKSPNATMIKILLDQLYQTNGSDQFLILNITFRKETVKKVLNQKLVNIYHLAY